MKPSQSIMASDDKMWELPFTLLTSTCFNNVFLLTTYLQSTGQAFERVPTCLPRVQMKGQLYKHIRCYIWLPNNLIYLKDLMSVLLFNQGYDQ